MRRAGCPPRLGRRAERPSESEQVRAIVEIPPPAHLGSRVAQKYEAEGHLPFPRGRAIRVGAGPSRCEPRRTAGFRGAARERAAGALPRGIPAGAHLAVRCPWWTRVKRSGKAPVGPSEGLWESGNLAPARAPRLGLRAKGFWYSRKLRKRTGGGRPREIPARAYLGVCAAQSFVASFRFPHGPFSASPFAAFASLNHLRRLRRSTVCAA